MFMHSDVIELCFKQKCDIAELFPYAAMFFSEKLALHGNVVKIMRFVNQSKNNKLELD